MKKRILMMLAAAVILQTAAWSATCVVGTVQSYIDLNATGGCTIGDKQFSNFSFALVQEAVPLR